ncbi:MAG: hypothetical protein GEU75_01045 [Dehalococcoidia bacterium]|nr:hypothetical protein [Dehalococcoidia bacterium]
MPAGHVQKSGKRQEGNNDVKKSYWAGVLSGRLLKRRRLLSAAGGLAVGAAALSLVGCGKNEGGVQGDASGLLGKAEDTTKRAKPGGTWSDYISEDVVNMDPLLNVSNVTFTQLVMVYSLLLKAGISAMGKPGIEDISGDAAESWEVAPDGLRITLKLRPNHKFDPRPPTNGRAMDSGDVKWSWEKFEKLAPNGVSLANSRSELAPIQSIETPDARTVTFRLAFPYGAITQLLAIHKFFMVAPKDETFNFKGDMRGSGPYFLDSYRPSSGITYKKNPDWYDKPRPFFDVINRPLISDYASGLSQFKAGNIWAFDVKAEDLLATKRDHPTMLMLGREVAPIGPGFTQFSKLPDSAFKDVRLRRAFSMMLDRDLLIEATENVNGFRDAGLPVKMVWHSHLGAGAPEWLDPRGTELGEGAKYFQYNPTEAKKMVEAAGLKTPVSVKYGGWVGVEEEGVKLHQTMAQMVAEGGAFQVEWVPLDYQTTYRSQLNSGGRDFTGLLGSRHAADSADINFTELLTPNGRKRLSVEPLPGLTDLVLKQQRETDPRLKTVLIRDIQKQLALDWPYFCNPGIATSFSLRWPWIANHGVFEIGQTSARDFTHYWYDESKRKA